MTESINLSQELSSPPPGQQQPGQSVDLGQALQKEPKVDLGAELAKPKPQPAQGGLTSVNPSVNVVGDYLTNWTKFAAGGIRPAFRAIVDGLVGLGNKLGVYDFDKGHHYAPNDPHLDGRAMDVDTINGETVGVEATPGIKKFISQALAADPRVRLGVPKEILKEIGTMGGRIFQDDPAHIHVEYDPVGQATGKVNLGTQLAKATPSGQKVDLGQAMTGQPVAHSGRMGAYGPEEAQRSEQGPVGQVALGPLNSAVQAFNAWWEPISLDSPILGGLVRSSGDLHRIKAIAADMWNTMHSAHDPGELTSAMQAIDDKYGLFTPANIAALYRDDPNDPVVSYLHNHPTIDDVGARTVANLIGLNPARLVTMLAKVTKLDKVAQAGARVAMQQPHIAKAVKATERVVNPHALLRQVETDASTPDEREQAGRTFKNATNRAVHTAVQEVEQDAGMPRGLTKDQRVEIARRSQNQDGNIRNIPNENVGQPGKKIGKTLDELAVEHREWIKKVTAEKVATGQLDPLSVENVETHLPLHDQPFGTVHTAEGMAPGETREGGVPGGMSRKSIFAKGKQQTEHRGASGIISELQANKQLSTRYDPYIQSLNYILPSRMRDELTRAADAFNRTGLAQQLTYRDVGVWDPATKSWVKQDVTGEAGQQAAKRWAMVQGRAQARTDVRGEFEKQGIIAPDENLRSMAQQHPQYAEGKAVQANKSVAEAHNRAAADSVAKSSADRLFGPGSRMAKKAQQLTEMAGQSGFNKARAQLFAKSVNTAARRLATERFERIQGAAEKEARAAGFTPGRDVTAVPMAAHVAVPENVVKFLKNEGASSRDALGAGGMISGFTDLYRMGIITNPVRHVFWNLGMNFLAATGGRGMQFFNPGAKDSIWRAPDAEWERLADKYNATIYQNAQHPIFGGHDLGTMTQTPLKKVYGETKQTFGGGLKGAVKGAEGVANAAATRAWQLNQKITFDLFEHRYAVQLFKDMVEKQGMSYDRAGIAVRKALGDYLGVSASGAEAAMKQVFLFYPWMKTVIPFQAKQLLEHPQFVTGPYGTIHRWNEHRGDPNVDHEAPGAIYMGRDSNSGQLNYASWPGPQRDVANLMESVDPTTGDVTPQKFMNEAVNHLNPILGMAYDIGSTQLQEAQEPNAAYHVAYNKNAPTAQKAQQFVESEVGHVPFAQLGQHAEKGATGGANRSHPKCAHGQHLPTPVTRRPAH